MQCAAEAFRVQLSAYHLLLCSEINSGVSFEVVCSFKWHLLLMKC